MLPWFLCVLSRWGGPSQKPTQAVSFKRLLLRWQVGYALIHTVMVIYSEIITKQKSSELPKKQKKKKKQNRTEKNQCGHKHNRNHSFWYSLQIYSSMVQRSRTRPLLTLVSHHLVSYMTSLSTGYLLICILSKKKIKGLKAFIDS